MLAADDPRLAARLAAFGQPGLGQVLRTRRARATLSIMVLVLIAAVAAVIYLMSSFRPRQPRDRPPGRAGSTRPRPRRPAGPATNGVASAPAAPVQQAHRAAGQARAALAQCCRHGRARVRGAGDAVGAGAGAAIAPGGTPVAVLSPRTAAILLACRFAEDSADGVTHRVVDVGGLAVHIAEAGTGPAGPAAARLPRVLVLLASSADRAGQRRISRRGARPARLRQDRRPGGGRTSTPCCTWPAT